MLSNELRLHSWVREKMLMAFFTKLRSSPAESALIPA
jgi:hypothetical protein